MDPAAVLEHLNASLPLIAPSMLKCDYGNLEGEIAQLEAAGAQALHWDVMDGHFVPNLSYGAPLIESLRGRTRLIFDAHLMISEPGRYLDDFLRAGCDGITVHAEVDEEPRALLERIRAAGAVAGLAINPETPVERIVPVLPACDLVLVMSVSPGFGGQEFMPQSLEKVRQLRERGGAGLLIGIDGGIGPKTIGRAAEAGANVFVVGSAIFGTGDYRTAIEELRAQAGGR